MEVDMNFKGLGRGSCALVILMVTATAACEDAEVTGDVNSEEGPIAPSEQDTSPPSLPETSVQTDDVASNNPDPGPPGPTDCEPGTGCLGEPCEGPEDCMSELCVDHMGGRVCSRTCDSECPQGWSCREVTMGGSDVAFICLSDHANLCRPCATSSDCVSAQGTEDACVVYGTWSGGAGIDAGLEGRFCASSCGADADCPEDFSCREVTTAEDVTLVRCVRSEGDCPCSETAVDLGLHTPCERSGEHGNCEGARQCTNTGLTACDAPDPSPEECNGIDDNCDGVVDEETCPNDNPCAVATCAGADGCAVELLDGVPCQDESLCMPDALCVAGVCEGDAIDCDDGNPCTDDHCDANLGCVHTYGDHPCDDEDPCTLGDACLDGVCQGGYDLNCECHVDAECLPKEDANLCNGTLFCDLSSLPYRCEVNPETVKSCEELTGPGSQCQEVVCVPGSGVCVTQPTNEGGLCDDGNPCTVNATCSNGDCDGGDSISCDDGNPCTDDGCATDTGCTHVDNQQPCDDDNVCTVGDLCAAGGCEGGAPLACDDGNPCTTSGCLGNQGCVQEPSDGPCDDGNACTTEDSCLNGLCVGAGSLVCDDGNPCTYDVCLLDGGCDHDPKIGACSDGDPCTVGETCQDGLCSPGTPVNCDDQNPCTEDACGVDGLCVHVGFDGPCDDGNACTYGDHCAGGVCAPQGADSCDDDNPCTTDTCSVGGGCEHNPNSLPCNDLDVCTTVDICAGGSCVGGNGLTCDDQNPCTEDLCQPGFGCTHTPIAGDCDDQNPCSVGDQCASGVCMPGSALPCDDTNPCTDDICEPDAGCTHEVNQAPCDDGSACTTNDTCDGGLCQGELSDACQDYNPCTDDACDDALGCLHEPNSAPCDDLNACTTNDQCVNGFCKPISSVDCNDANGCTDDSCEPDVGCIHTANDAPCDDGDVCTAFDKCAESGCYGGIALNCNDGDPCSVDLCDPVQGCYHQASTAPCNDNNTCTEGESCAGGVCQGGQPLSCAEGGPCQESGCDPLSGCTLNSEDGLCDDDNVCTNESCGDNGECVTTFNDGVDCDDGDPLTDGDSCSQGSCSGLSNPCGPNLKLDPQQTKPGWTLCYLDSDADDGLKNGACSSLFPSSGKTYGCWHSNASFPHENINGSVDNGCKANVQNSTSYSAWGGSSHILTVCIQN